jgi:hypothetical protein
VGRKPVAASICVILSLHVAAVAAALHRRRILADAPGAHVARARRRVGAGLPKRDTSPRGLDECRARDLHREGDVAASTRAGQRHVAAVAVSAFQGSGGHRGPRSTSSISIPTTSLPATKSIGLSVASTPSWQAIDPKSPDARPRPEFEREIVLHRARQLRAGVAAEIDRRATDPDLAHPQARSSRRLDDDPAGAPNHGNRHDSHVRDVRILHDDGGAGDVGRDATRWGPRALAEVQVVLPTGLERWREASYGFFVGIPEVF